MPDLGTQQYWASVLRPDCSTRHPLILKTIKELVLLHINWPLEDPVLTEKMGPFGD